MRITVVISTLRTGGAQRVISIMANYWATHHQDVTVITLASKEADCYALDPRVKRIGLGLEASSKNLAQAARHNVKRLKRLRTELRASCPDVVISFIDVTNVLTFLASIGLRVPVIVSERSDPYQHRIGLAWSALRSLVYRHADGVVLQSHGLRDWARGFLQDNAIHVIPNPVRVVPNGSKYASSRHGGGRTVVAMGRLGREKRFDLLLQAFSQCAKMHDHWSLIIIGEGEERRSLEMLTMKLGLTSRVTLPGLVHDPMRILLSADLFVLSSRYEGFPNALLEAMACGVAVISTDCGSGAREIIRDGVNGVLVPPSDVNALASAMDRLMKDQAERERLGTRAVEVTERFGVERIMGMWDDVLTQTCQGTT